MYQAISTILRQVSFGIPTVTSLKLFTGAFGGRFAESMVAVVVCRLATLPVTFISF
jgi:hypothetical protein